ncbi:phosphatase [Streptacidiphilus sp. EB129]|uniref:phosphatase n=1 Tax=Streptacidiphilus sp. EB129 TaxID=3156262 RepID=UPI0035167A00
MIAAEELYAHLMACRIAGQVATPRENNLRNYSRFARRDPGVMFGLDPEGSWDEAEVLELMARRCGVSADPEHRHGQDTIDPDLTVRALDRLAGIVADTAARRGAVLLGTGHPRPLGGFYADLGDALGAAGCAVLTPAHNSPFLMHFPDGARSCALGYVRRTAVLRVYEEAPPNGAPRSGADGGPGPGALSEPVHTHSPQPVRFALAALADGGDPRPDLVLGDHGWACGAGRLGVRAAGLADSNDPGVFVAEAEGDVELAVPLDDGVRPECYGLLSAYVLQQAGMSQ